MAAAYAAGRAVHPALRCDLAAYRSSVEQRLDARLRCLRLAPAPGRRAEWLGRAAHADLYLAVACEQRVAGAWEALLRDLTPRLTGLAHERGLRGAEAETVAGEVLGDLSLPASGEDPRPLLLGYAGVGSLFGFTAVLLTRRLARRARDPRERRRVPLEPAGEPGRDEGAPAHAAATAPPAEQAADADLAARFEAALTEASRALTARERLALVAKHRDGRSQREIAVLLKVGEPRVSRLLASAVGRLRGALAARMPDLGDGTGGPALSARLSDVVARHLARLEPVPAPPSGGGLREVP